MRIFTRIKMWYQNFSNVSKRKVTKWLLWEAMSRNAAMLIFLPLAVCQDDGEIWKHQKFLNTDNID